MRKLWCAVVAVAVAASGCVAVADTAGDPTAVKSENGKYLDKEGNPTFKVAADGTVVPGLVVKTPTRRLGVTILRVPLHVTKPGTYTLQMHADGIGQVANRTARIAFVKRRPTSPLWQVVRPLRIVVIHGARAGTAGLSSALGRGYLVRTLADSELYTAVDPTSGTAGAAVVVDLGTVPMQTLIGLHALLPEVKIVGLTNDPAVAAYARTIGVDAVLGRSASGAEIAGVIVKALRQS